MRKKKRQKILYVVTKSNFGGAQRYVYDLATHLPHDHYEPVVACGGTGGKQAPLGTLHEQLLEARVRTIPSIHFMRNMSFGQDVRAFFELLRILRKERPAVLHLSSSKAGGLGVLAGRLTQVPIIIFTSHGLTFEEAWRPHWQQKLILFFTWLTILLSTKTILISHNDKKRIDTLPHMQHKTVVIHNGVTTEDFMSREEARQTLASDMEKSACNKPWIGVIAEYHKNKNLDMLIKSMSHLKDISPTLVLIGEGDERIPLTQLARELGISQQDFFTGYVTHASRYLKALDIFVLPSKKEGLPYVLLEAGLATLPVIVSDIPGTTEIITDGQTGKVVASEPATLARAIRSLLENPITGNTYAHALHTHVSTTFSIEHMLEQTMALYTSPNPSIS